MNSVRRKADSVAAPIGTKTAILHPIGLGADMLSGLPLLPPILRTSDVTEGLYRLLLVYQEFIFRVKSGLKLHMGCPLR